MHKDTGAGMGVAWVPVLGCWCVCGGEGGRAGLAMAGNSIQDFWKEDSSHPYSLSPLQPRPLGWGEG